MGACFDGVGLEMTVHAEALASSAEQGRQDDSEGVEEQQPVAPLRVGNADRGKAHTEMHVLGISEAGLDRPALGVKVDDLSGGCLPVAEIGRASCRERV